MLFSFTSWNLSPGLISLQQSGETALILAVFTRNLELANLLLDRGADPNLISGVCKFLDCPIFFVSIQRTSYVFSFRLAIQH